jgi:hypothetical protein
VRELILALVAYAVAEALAFASEPAAYVAEAPVFASEPAAYVAVAEKPADPCSHYGLPENWSDRLAC